MNKVLIAVDYHPNSEKVVKAGYVLAQTMNAKVCLLHVVTEFGYYNTQYPTFMGYDSSDLGTNDKIRKDLLKVSEDYLTKIAKHLKDSEVEIHTVEGESADTIMAYAKKWHANMIVMGTHSHSFLDKVLMGTVTSKVIENTVIPVYLVPIKQK